MWLPSSPLTYGSPPRAASGVSWVNRHCQQLGSANVSPDTPAPLLEPSASEEGLAGHCGEAGRLSAPNAGEQLASGESLNIRTPHPLGTRPGLSGWVEGDLSRAGASTHPISLKPPILWGEGQQASHLCCPSLPERVVGGLSPHLSASPIPQSACKCEKDRERTEETGGTGGEGLGR